MTYTIPPGRILPVQAKAGGGFEGVVFGGEPPASSAFFEDGFESGDLSATQNGFQWLGGAFIQVSTNNPKTGSYSLQFNFQPADGDGDAIAEQRFDMGALYKEVEIEFDLYIPDGTEPWGSAAYSHVADSPSNNKFLRLWASDAGNTAPNGYNSVEKVGASLWADGDGGSTFIFDWNQGGGGVGPKNTTIPGFISPSDRGTWINVRMYFKHATYYDGSSSTAGDGRVKLWKNDALLIDDPMDNFSATGAGDHAWQHGYLLGYQNSAQASELNLHIDNLKFSGVAA